MGNLIPKGCLIIALVFIPIILGTGFLGLFSYIIDIFKYEQSWIIKKTDKLKFIQKLDILLSLKS